MTQEQSAVVGSVEAVMLGPDGSVKARATAKNLITQNGDQVIAERAAGIGALAAPTGMRIGTGSTAASKTGAGAAIVTPISGGNKAFDSTAASALNGAARRITWVVTYGAGVATTASAIVEAVLANDTIGSASTGTGGTVARSILSGLGSKGAADTLILTWTWDHQGT